MGEVGGADGSVNYHSMLVNFIQLKLTVGKILAFGKDE